MVIIAGRLYVPADVRDEYVAAHAEVIEQARAMPGCMDLALSADPVEPGRVNMYECWETTEHLDAWRAIANPPPRPDGFSGDVHKYHVSSVAPPFP